MRPSVLFAFLLPAAAAAQVPAALGYQGRLTDAAGAALVGRPAMQFAFFDAADGGNLIWCEQQASVPLTDGYYSVQLGTGAACASGPATPLSSAFGAPSRFLEITVDGSALRPRLAVASVPFSLNAQTAQFAQVAQTGGTFQARSLGLTGEAAVAGQGTIAGFQGKAQISGGGSAFLSQVGEGDVIEVASSGGPPTVILVASVEDDANLTAASVLTANLANSTYTVRKPVAQILRSDGSLGVLANAQGRVGIGTVTPRVALDVNGDLHASGDVKASSVSLAATFNAVKRLECTGRWGTWDADKNTCTDNIVASSTPIVFSGYPSKCTGGATKTCSCWSIIAALPQLVAAGINLNGQKMWCSTYEMDSAPAPSALRADQWGGTDGTMKCADDYAPCLYVDAKATGGGRSSIELGCWSKTAAIPAWCCR